MVVIDCHTFIQELTIMSTPCQNLVIGWPDYISIKDVSRQGIGGIIIGENKLVTPTVFWLEWPNDIKKSMVSSTNPTSSITNSDLKMAGLFTLFLIMEDVCLSLLHAHVTLFSNNTPTVHRAQWLTFKHSNVAMQLIHALALICLQLCSCSHWHHRHTIPVIWLGAKMALQNGPWLTNPFWHFFPLPHQASLAIYHPSSEIATEVVSVLRAAGTGFYNGCFAARVWGIWLRGKNAVNAVISVIIAIGITISLAWGWNPIKLDNSDKLFPSLA